MFAVGAPTHRRHHQTGTETFINSERCSPWSPCLTDTRSGTKVEKCSHPLVWTALVWDFCLCSRRAQLLLSNLNDMNYTLQNSSKQPRRWRGGRWGWRRWDIKTNQTKKKRLHKKFPPMLPASSLGLPPGVTSLGTECVFFSDFIDVTNYHWAN